MPTPNTMEQSVPVKTPAAFQITNKINCVEHISFGTTLKTMQRLKKKLLISRAAGVAIGLAATLCCLSASAAVTDVWLGTVSSDPTVAGNWSGGVPVIGVNNGTAAVNTNLDVGNGANFPLVWNQPGTTTFTGYFINGVSVGVAGSMTLQSGNLIFNAGTGTAIFGQNNKSVINTFNQTGGSFTFNGSGGMFVGNGFSATQPATGIMNISGGTFTNNFNAAFTTGPGTDNGLFLGRTGGVGQMNLSGTGSFVLLGTGTMPADITITNASSYINFAGGPTATLALYNGGTAGASRNNFNSYVNGGHILIGGATVTASQFNHWTAGNLDFYQPVPVIGVASIAPSNTVYVGTPVTLSGTLSYIPAGTTYQWQTDNGGGGASFSNIGGATSTNYVLNTTSLLGTYEYQLVASTGGSLTSAPVSLTVLAATAPVFVTNMAAPSGTLNYVGVSQTYTVLFAGTLPITYQWQFSPNPDGSGAVALNSQTNAILNLTNLQLTDSGYYSLQASNGVSPYTSNSPWRALTVLSMTNFYVATNGSDSNPGTLAQPFLTIAKAAGVMVAGDTCYIRGGTYRETVTPGSSGSAALPITYCPYNNEVVTISGANVVSGWSVYTNGIYQATFAGSLGDEDQIFVDGVMMNLARWPNTSLDVSRPVMAVAATGRAVVTNSDGTMIDTFTDTNLTQPSGFFIGAQIHELPGPMYAAQTGLVTNYTPGTLTFHCRNAYTPIAGNPYYLFGLLSLLDTPGEWFINTNANKLYLWPPQNDSPVNHMVEAKQRDYGFDLSGKSYINLQGLQFFACAVNSSSTSRGLVLDGLGCLYVSHFSLINTNGVFNYHVADTGLILNGTNNVLRNSTIAYSAGNGVTLLGASNRVQNCVIHDVDYAQLDCGAVGTGLGADSVGQVICSNTCYNSACCLLVIRRLAAGRINNNVLYRAMLRTSDGGAIRTFGHDGQNTEIDHNIFSDNICVNHKASGVYLDSGSPDFIVHHNLLYNTSWALQYNLPSVNVKWFNNTAVSSYYSLEGAYVGSQANSEVFNNIFTAYLGIASTNPGDVALSNNLTSNINPLFVSTNLLNFQLQGNSPGVNAGIVLPPYTDGYSGSAPDIGAFEYGQTPWTAGATNAVLPPAGPTGLTASGSASSAVQLTWIDNSTHESQFIVERSLDSETFSELVTLPSGTTNYTDFTVQKGIPYYYRVRADESMNSNYQPVKVSGHALGIIEANSLDAQSGGIAVTSTGIGNIFNGYWAEYAATDFGSGATNITLSVASGATTLNNYIQVRLDSTTGTMIANINILGTGGYGVYTNVSSAVATVSGVHDLYLVFVGGAGVCNLAYFSFGAAAPLAAPPIPQSVTATGIATNQVQVTWASVSGSQSGFAVENSTDNQNFTQISVTASNTFAFVDSGLAPGTTRYYRVRSFNLLGFSDYSQSVAGSSWTGIEQWRYNNWGTTNNVGVAADTANPSGDGIANLMKYALGLNPLVFVTGGLPTCSLSNGVIYYNFTRLLSATDITYQVIIVSDLQTGVWAEFWNSATNPYPSLAPSITQSVAIPTINQPAQFFRLGITRP
jgi:hypothetical protein